MKILFSFLLVGGTAIAQTPDLKTASGYPKMVQNKITGWIERAAVQENCAAVQRAEAAVVIHATWGPLSRTPGPRARSMLVVR